MAGSFREKNFSLSFCFPAYTFCWPNCTKQMVKCLCISFDWSAESSTKYQLFLHELDINLSAISVVLGLLYIHSPILCPALILHPNWIKSWVPEEHNLLNCYHLLLILIAISGLAGQYEPGWRPSANVLVVCVFRASVPAQGKLPVKTLPSDVFDIIQPKVRQLNTLAFYITIIQLIYFTFLRINRCHEASQ